MNTPLRFLLLALLLCTRILSTAQVTYSPLFNYSTFPKSIDLSKPIGSIPGTAGATPSGSASYTIPIACPPGTNGVVPKLSVVYNSQAACGFLGQGWSLSGLSSIGRAGKDFYHDGTVSAINYTNQTPFILDGLRLDPKDGGINGADGTKYRTESESYSVVTSFGLTSGGSPSYFKVVTKDGTTIEYGNSPDSRLMSEDNANVILWQVSKIQDTKGNYIKFEYDNFYQEPKIKKIKYTGNINGLAPYNEIIFKYDDADHQTSYVNGDQVLKSSLLTEIEIKEIGGDIFKKYQFNYAHDMHLSYLKFIEEIAGDGSKLNDTRFKYGDLPVSNFFVQETNVDVDVTNNKIQTGDYNGDGKDDILRISKGSTGLVDMNMYFNGPSYTLGKSMTGLSDLKEYGTASTYQYTGAVSSDYDGDGKEEVLCINYDENIIEYSGIKLWDMSTFLDTKIYTPDNSSSIIPTRTIVPPPSPNNLIAYRPSLSGDFDGDKRADYLTIGRRYSCTSCYYATAYHIFSIHLNFPGKGETNSPLVIEATGALDEAWAKKIHDNPQLKIIDFDGDGKSEIFGVKDKDFFVINFKKLSSGNYSVNVLLEGTFSTSENPDILGVGDFNGDGKSDILCKMVTSAGTYKILYGTGKNFDISPFSFYRAYNKSIALTVGGTTSTVDGDQIHIADYDGDGKSDVLHMKRNTTNPAYYTNTYFDIYFGGLSGYYMSFDYNGFVDKDVMPVVGDMNGDGKADLNFVRNGSSGTPKIHTLFFNQFSKHHLLEKVTDGWNRTTTFGYNLLTEAGGHFTKGSFSSYPMNSPQYGIYVVTSMQSDNGIGGLNAINFKYENLMMHRVGRGLLGFEKITSIDLNSNIRTENTYDVNTDFYIPYLKTTKTYLHSTGVQLTQNDNVINFTRIGSGYCFKQENISNTTKNLLKGVEMTATNTYDGYGNITNISSVSTGGETLTSSTVSTFVATGSSPIPNNPSTIVTTTQRGSKPAVATWTSIQYTGSGSILSSSTAPDAYRILYVKDNFEYDDYGNVIKSYKTDNAGITSLTATSKFTYDGKGRFVTIEENAMTDKKYITTHKFWGQPVSVTDYNGLTTSYTYNNWGKLTSKNIPTSVSTGYTVNYTENWDLGTNRLYYTLVEDPSAPDVKTWYDYLGRAITVKKETFNTEWTESNTVYDAKGNVLSSTNEYTATEGPLTSTNTYDELNRLQSSTSFAGTTNYAYTQGGGYTTTTITYPDGKIKKTKVDATEKVVESTNGTAGTVVLDYDSRGNEISVGLRGTFGGVISYPIRKEYDVSGRLNKLIDLDAGTTKYTYNTFGQLTRQEDANGKVSTFTYDKMKRLIEKNLDGYVTTYAFYGPDKDYRVQSAEINGPDGFVREYFDYEVGSGVILYTKNINGTSLSKNFTYDNYNRLQATNYLIGGGYGSGFRTKNYYDANGFLSKITTNFGSGSPKTLYEATAMNGRKRVTGFKRLDGLNAAVEYEYDRPTRFYTPGKQDLVTGYDIQNGNVLYREDHLAAPTYPKEFFTYDAIDRLTKSEASINGFSGPIHHPPLSITYDSLVSGTLSKGKITFKSDVGKYSYSGYPDNAVKGILVGSSAVISHETQNVTYNAFNKTKKITEKVGSTDYEETFLYDANEDRAYSRQSQGISPSLSVARQRWYMDDYEMQVKGANTQYIHYISGDAGLCGIVVQEGGSFYYYSVYTDHLGSIVNVSDEYGTTVADQNYDAWGKERDPGSWDYYPAGFIAPKPDWLYRGYTGHEMLPEYGLVNMNGRIYDPANGRMLRPDNYVQENFNTQSYNRYSYCLNNPLKYVDPSGNQFESTGGFSFSSNIMNSYTYGGMYNGIPYNFSYNSYSFYATKQFQSVVDNGFYVLTYMNYVSETGNGFSISGGIAGQHGSYAQNFATSTQISVLTGYKESNRYKVTESPWSASMATFTLGAISADVAVPDPSDAVPLKWAAYGVAGAIAYETLHPTTMQDFLVTSVYTTATLVNKMNQEIAAIKQKLSGPSGYQYALVATAPGNYPVMVSGFSFPVGTTYLNTGDVWKYGETTMPNRYSAAELKAIGPGVMEVRQFYGNRVQIKVQEKLMIYNYYFQNGSLPPGNKIFR